MKKWQKSKRQYKNALSMKTQLRRAHKRFYLEVTWSYFREIILAIIRKTVGMGQNTGDNPIRKLLQQPRPESSKLWSTGDILPACSVWSVLYGLQVKNDSHTFKEWLKKKREKENFIWLVSLKYLLCDHLQKSLVTSAQTTAEGTS